MTYTPTAWVDYGIPCIEAATLNNAEAGIDRAQGDVMVLRGLTANIPASDPLLIGRLYFETDLLERGWRDNGAGWDLVTVPPPYDSLLLATGEITPYAFFADGAMRIGELKAYTVDALAGNTDIQVAHLADSTLSFTAPNTIASAGNLLVGWAVNDRMLIKGSANNDGEVLVTGIGGAPANLTISAAVNEIAGAVISLYKVAAHSNNVVQDTKTGRMWSRYTSTGEAVGVLSNGTLAWTGIVFPLYNAANTISMIVPGNIVRITGGAALTQFHVGDLLQCGGFANAVNNLANLYVLSVTINGPNLDIAVDAGNEVLIAEGAVGDTIGLVTRCIYNYMAGACLAGLSGYTDWRVPYDTELASLREMEAPNAVPDAVAFPGWPAASIWSDTTQPSGTGNAIYARYSDGMVPSSIKTTLYLAALVRS